MAVYLPYDMSRVKALDLSQSFSVNYSSFAFRGTPVVIDLRKVVELGITPRVNTGIAHRNAGVGQVGAGLVRPPIEVFEEALVAYAERYFPEESR